MKFLNGMTFKGVNESFSPIISRTVSVHKAAFPKWERRKKVTNATFSKWECA